MGDDLTWGILGCSKFALEHMLPAMQIAKNNKCIAIATTISTRLEQSSGR